MVEAQNPHWNEVVHAGPLTWVTFMLVRLDGSKAALGQERQEDIAEFLTASPDTGVRQLKVRVEPLTWYVGLSLVVEGRDTEQAFLTSVKAALGGLAHTGVVLDQARVMDSRIAQEEDLVAQCQKGVISDIRHPNFKVDPLPVNELMIRLAPAVEIAALEAAFAA